MHFSSTDERRFALCERDSLFVRAGDPAAACDSEQDLTEPCFVWADHATWLEVDDVRVGFAFPLGKLDRGGEPHVVGPLADPLGEARAESEDLHRPIFSQEALTHPSDTTIGRPTLRENARAPVSGGRRTRIRGCRR